MLCSLLFRATADINPMDNYNRLLTALNVVKLARDSLGEIEMILEDMRSLAEQAAREDIDPIERLAIQEQIVAHAAAIDEITATAEMKARDISKDDPGTNPLTAFRLGYNPFNKIH